MSIGNDCQHTFPIHNNLCDVVVEAGIAQFCRMPIQVLYTTSSSLLVNECVLVKMANGVFG